MFYKVFENYLNLKSCVVQFCLGKLYKNYQNDTFVQQYENQEAKEMLCVGI